MGNHLAGADTVWPVGHPGRGHPGLGTRPGRDDGRHHGHRQQHPGGVSLLEPGYSMASIIANEFAEAVSQLHTDALIEIGLILFIITLLLNIVARFPGLAGGPPDAPGGTLMSHFSELMNANRVARGRQRKAANAVMLSLTGLVTAPGARPALLDHRLRAHPGREKYQPGLLHPFCRDRWEWPAEACCLPSRHTGRNAPGSSLCHPARGPGRLLRGALPEHPAGVALRFSTDVLSGIPSIVVGLFAYAIIVVPMGHYSGLAGGRRWRS